VNSRQATLANMMRTGPGSSWVSCADLAIACIQPVYNISDVSRRQPRHPVVSHLSSKPSFTVTVFM